MDTVLLYVTQVQVGLSTEYFSAKIPRNRLGMVSVVVEESVHSEAFRILRKSQVRGFERKEMGWKKLVLQKSCSSKHNVFVGDSFGTKFQEFI